MLVTPRGREERVRRESPCICASFRQQLATSKQTRRTKKCLPKKKKTPIPHTLFIHVCSAHTLSRSQKAQPHTHSALPPCWRCDGEPLGQSQTDGPHSRDSISMTDTVWRATQRHTFKGGKKKAPTKAEKHTYDLQTIINMMMELAEKNILENTPTK